MILSIHIKSSLIQSKISENYNTNTNLPHNYSKGSYRTVHSCINLANKWKLGVYRQIDKIKIGILDRAWKLFDEKEKRHNQKIKHIQENKSK